MRNILYTLAFSSILALVCAGIVFEKFVSYSDPEYMVLEHREKILNGRQTFDVDCYIKKPVPNPQYTTLVFYKNGEQYEQVFSMGPIDPCSEDMIELRVKEEEKIKPYGNMSIDHICPFKEGYYYLKDYAMDFEDEMPPEMVPGQYKLVIEGTTIVNGIEKKIMNEEFYLNVTE